MLNDESEHYNEDGTLIIKSPVWLDKPEFKFYLEENFLVLRYLRDADGLEDINLSISLDEYFRKKHNMCITKTKKIQMDHGVQWIPMDSEILDMYQYDYELKEVEDLKKLHGKLD